MPVLSIPRPLHEVLGERQTPFAIVLVAIAGTGVPLAFALAAPAELFGVEAWRSILAVVLIADVAAGAVANLTAGTNDFYATRSALRWVFIAVHVHLPLVALLLGLPLAEALGLWAGTIIAAAVVNALAGRALQRPVAGTLLVALVVAALLTATGALAAIAVLFAFKVSYAFAVDHRAERRD